MKGIVMNKVKIEVIKTHFDEELAREFGVDSACPMHKVGESFISLGFDKPQGFCDEAWKAIYQYVFDSPIAIGRMYFTLKIGLKSQALQ